MTEGGEEYTYTETDGTLGGKLRSEPGNPSAVAQEFIAEWNDQRVVWRGDFYKWVGTHWEIEDRTDVMSTINKELMYSYYQKWDRETKKIKDYAWSPNNSSLTNLETQIRLQAALPSTMEPARGGEFVFLANGRYSIVAGGLLKHDPSIFNLHSCPFDYDPSAQCPEWDQFMKTTFGGDEVAIEVHYRWMAVELLRATDLQKAYMLLGQTRSGKGTAMRVANALLGSGQVTGLALDQISKDFGLAPLIGKSVCRVNDIRDAGRATGTAVQRLLSIVGADEVQIDRKNKDPWIGELPVLFTLTSNEVPRLPDDSGAIIARFIFNRTVGSREDMQDPALASRIIAHEMPGVLNRVLEYVHRVYDEWPVSVAGLETKTAMQEMSQPLKVWMDEAGILVGPDFEIAKGAAYHSYHEWAKSTGVARPMDSRWFGRSIKAMLPGITDHRPLVDGKPVPTWHGFGFYE